MNYDAWAKTDVGKKRLSNEDSLYVAPDRDLVLVLDGMGGHRAGEVASLLAMETMSTFYRTYVGADERNPELFENFDQSFSYQANLLRQAAFEANRVVLEKSQEEDQYSGMGCTVAGIAIHDHMVSMINVGDSRMYLIRNRTLEQISRDHTLAEDQVERGIMSREEARDSQLRHILSSVVGVDGRIRVHMDEMAIVPGDVYLLCTDGLTVVMEDEEILSLLLEHGAGPDAVDLLVDEVNERGGPDNTTIALLSFHE